MAWKTVEDECGVEIVHKTGGLVFGAGENPVHLPSLIPWPDVDLIKRK